MLLDFSMQLRQIFCWGQENSFGISQGCGVLKVFLPVRYKTRNASTVTAAWLARSPQRYPRIPQRGIARNTLVIRMPRLSMLIRNVEVVFPSPLIELIRAAFV